ncbi:sensor histidine kinase [Spongiivirga sp. MCCC 1A20706]|uniref:sensor histidine kinase n=1 Tax=Spongiivirga sp. MCCC 1A20706 TaxID=3160963 RepID=UPI003977AB69
MRRFLLNNYTSLIKAGVITLGLAILLNKAGLIIVNPDVVSRPVATVINILSVVSCLLLLSFLINKFSIYKVLGVLSLLFAATFAELYIPIEKNPFTIPLLILFWLGAVHLLIPEFFNKYKLAIFAVYTLIILYYYYFFFNQAPDVKGNYRINFSYILLIPIPVFVSLWIYEQWRWLKTLRADKAKAELALLKSQINPHFFFNTLNNLYGLVVEQSDDAPEVVLKLSDMMRYTIYDGREDRVLLKDEIRYLENYIDLHKIRYQKKVEITFTHEVEPDIEVVPLLFIILLENAFKHGVEKMKDDAFIRMRMASREKKLLFKIENSFDKSAVKKAGGIGLENLKQRLDYLYPNRHELLLEETEATYIAQLNLEIS